ncbi:MAG: hypothetical protein LBH07_01110 [Treponema sp.]|nr:hypothetical protein [Treponema sp.]
MEYNPLYDGKVIRTEKVDGVTHYYYSKTDKKMVIDTGRTMFTVSDKIVSPEKIPRWISSHKLLGWLHYRIFRGWFLRWLLEY